MRIENFFKFPFYRIFFSLIIGIITLEASILTYNYRFRNIDKTIDGILIKVQKEEPKIQYLGKFSPQEYDIESKTINDPKSENLKVEIGNFTVYIKFNSWSGYIFFTYCLFATLVGEIFCSIADIIFGFLFGHNPFSCKDSLEDCLPWEENTEDSKERNTKLQIKVSDFENLEEKILEFSEMHFILSRNMVGLALLLSILLCFLSSIGIIVLIANLVTLTLLFLYKEKYTIIGNIVLILSIIYIFKPTFLAGIIALSIIILKVLSIIYRIQANRIIIHSKTEK